MGKDEAIEAAYNNLKQQIEDTLAGSKSSINNLDISDSEKTRRIRAAELKASQALRAAEDARTAAYAAKSKKQPKPKKGKHRD